MTICEGSANRPEFDELRAEICMFQVPKRVKSRHKFDSLFYDKEDTTSDSAHSKP